MNNDERQLFELFFEINDAYQAHRFEDDRAGLDLFEEELNAGTGSYSLMFYARASLAAESMSRLIKSAKIEARLAEMKANKGVA